MSAATPSVETRVKILDYCSRGAIECVKKVGRNIKHLPLDENAINLIRERSLCASDDDDEIDRDTLESFIGQLEKTGWDTPVFATQKKVYMSSPENKKTYKCEYSATAAAPVDWSYGLTFKDLMTGIYRMKKQTDTWTELLCGVEIELYTEEAIYLKILFDYGS